VYSVTFNPDTIPEYAVGIRMMNSTYRLDTTGPERREVYTSLPVTATSSPRWARYLLESTEILPLLHYSYNEPTGEYYLTAEIPADVDSATLRSVLILIGSEAYIRCVALRLDTMEQGIHPEVAAMFAKGHPETTDTRLASALEKLNLHTTVAPRGLFELGYADNLRPEPIMIYAESSTLVLGTYEFRNIYALITALPNWATTTDQSQALLTFNEVPLKFGNLSVAAAGDGSMSALYLNVCIPAQASAIELGKYLQRLAGQAASVRNYLAN